MIEKYLSMYLFTSIGRPVYPGYPGNFAILSVAVVCGVIAGSLRLVRSGGDIGASIATGFFMGAAVFIAWSLTREADPDHDMAAFVSAGVAFVLSILWNVPPLNLLGLGVIIVFLRMINRIVGPPFRPIDTAAAAVFVLLLAWQGDWLLVFFAALAFLIDAVMPPNPLRYHGVLALVSAGIGLFVIRQQTIAQLFLSSENVIACLAVLITFALFFFTVRDVRTKPDAPGYTLDLNRIRACMIWLFLLGVGFMLFGGDAGIKTLVPLWGMFAGPPLYAIGNIIAKRSEQRAVTQLSK